MKNTITFILIAISVLSCKKDYIKPTPEPDTFYSATDIVNGITGTWVYVSSEVYSEGGFSTEHPMDVVSINSTNYTHVDGYNKDSELTITDTQINFNDWGEAYKVITLSTSNFSIYNDAQNRMRYYTRQ